MASYNLNEILKKRALSQKGQEKKEMDLGDTARVKVLSPMQQVFKRFIRNRLAIFGTCTLLFMFVFSFIGPIFYKYSQSETMYKYEGVVSPYSFVQLRKEYTGYTLDPEVTYNRTAVNKTNSNINTMEKAGQTTYAFLASDGKLYILNKEGESIYSLAQADLKKTASFGEGLVLVGTYDGIGKTVKFEREDLGAEFVALAAENCKGNSGEFVFEDVTYTFTKGSAKKSYNIYTEPSEGFNYYGAALDEGFENAATAAAVGEMFEYGGKQYVVTSPDEGSFEAYAVSDPVRFMLYTKFGFDTYATGLPLTDSFKVQALNAVYGGGPFQAERLADTEAYLEEVAEAAVEAQNEHEDVAVGMEEETAPVQTEAATEAPAETGEAAEGGEAEIPADSDFVTDTFTITPSEEHEGVFVITSSTGEKYAELNTLVVRRNNGDDTMDLDLKYAIRGVVEKMMADFSQTETLTYQIPMQTEDGKNKYDEDGNLEYADSEITITRRNDGEYNVQASQQRLLIDKFADPSAAHVLGTDGDGFDVLARIMYGGRISLMVGFVVVILETFLGVIMGGLAGFFGGWVDNLVMRLVDIFYCLPFMPIMIIIGALMDAMRMDVRIRLFVMMAALGVMGWAGIARLVRGQILSLREQEFMVAAEATGLPISRRIFRHLVPNVMPQLIVSATMGLGSTILTESTLSFLGLGVKHPLATWGTMINSVSSAAAMEQYAYIWIPVGLLICFTVIAFNFVGDGLRDAFDPKGKR